jgi:hypothetical protein
MTEAEALQAVVATVVRGLVPVEHLIAVTMGLRQAVLVVPGDDDGLGVPVAVLRGFHWWLSLWWVDEISIGA